MSDKPVVNIDDVVLSAYEHDTRFGARSASLGEEVGAEKLGCRLIEVPAGKCAYPFHSHHANEEMFFIVEGTGTYRFGGTSYAVRAGDLLAAPVGGAEHAHQLVNDSEAPLKYLAVSTMIEPDVMEYPDSGKFGAFAGSPPGGDKDKRRFSAFAPWDATVAYWDGEE